MQQHTQAAQGIRKGGCLAVAYMIWSPHAHFAQFFDIAMSMLAQAGLFSNAV